MMKLERLILQNFKCFGPNPETIWLDPALTTFIGGNGSGKTAALLALQRMFGTNLGRTVVRHDFHVSPSELDQPPRARSLAVDYIFAFPELSIDGTPDSAVPSFFHHMTADENGKLKCRLRLEATWTDDGSAEGIIEHRSIAVKTMEQTFTEDDAIDLRGSDRARIKMIYVPALRDGASQVNNFLRSPLWRAMRWSKTLREVVSRAGSELNSAFISEPGIDRIANATMRHWQDLYSGGTYATPKLAPVDIRFGEFIRKVGFLFQPDHEGAERSLEELSDGQRSLFHLSMTASILDVESSVVRDQDSSSFDLDNLALPALTIIGIEEPENNLAPFYLSRIVRQIQALTSDSHAQAIISSHSASILARVKPEQIRHFRTNVGQQSSCVRSILLPPAAEEASKYIREAVRAYPELYFASFVILGEGASEEVVIPRLAEALEIPIDRSFVAVVPLGGRHVRHLWRLLYSLEIPHATLLDLDLGRAGGGWGRIATTCSELVANGTDPLALVPEAQTDQSARETLAAISSYPTDISKLNSWCRRLQNFGVYFCSPLDLDMSMLMAYQDNYQSLEAGWTGPASIGDASAAVLGSEGDPTVYADTWDNMFRWYRYLFLGRGKPHTHVRVLATTDEKILAANVPSELRTLLNHVNEVVFTKPAAPAKAVEKE
jgi:putative ATP-dependent endonuclease of the OLD family